jgi:hypothetical protein
LWKVNGGGQTSRITAEGNTGPFFDVPTLILRCDVAHDAPGTEIASIAGLDHVPTNGLREEIWEDSNVRNMLGLMIEAWKKQNKNGRIPGGNISTKQGW